MLFSFGQVVDPPGLDKPRNVWCIVKRKNIKQLVTLLPAPSDLPSYLFWHCPSGHILSRSCLSHRITALRRLISLSRLISGLEIGYRNFKDTGIAQLLIVIIKVITFWLSQPGRFAVRLPLQARRPDRPRSPLSFMLNGAIWDPLLG